MKRPRYAQLTAAICGLAVPLTLSRICAADVPALHASVGPAGLKSLQFGNDDLLSNGDFSVQKVTLIGADGQEQIADVRRPQTTFDPSHNRLTETFSWGTIRCTYGVAPDRLRMTVDVRNASPATITGIQLQLLEVRFPNAPTGWIPNYAYLGANRGDPTAEIANYGSGTLAVCDDDVNRPLLLGFPGRADLMVRPVGLYTSNIGFLSPYLDPYLKRPIPPGGTDTFHVSLRFGPGSATVTDIAGDLYRKLGATFPARLKWPDRRPIGTEHLAASETRLHSPNNPRGWFADPTGVDITTEAGRAAFRTRVMKYADESITQLKQMNAQGMITWDIEGEEYPQATTYIGDPRLLSVLDPEMDAIADAYFKKFRDAGLRTGVCIRPQRLVHTPEKTEQVEVNADPTAVTQLLFDKMKYANNRWGCTIFYVDSNGDPNVPYDPSIFENLVDRLTRAHIDALVIPEHRNARYYGSTAPYTELRLGVVGTPDRVRVAYPRAFMANYVPDGPIAKEHDALVKAVRAGDVLMFRAWWHDEQNDEVRRVYQDAAP